jgi:hypothetical protein
VLDEKSIRHHLDEVENRLGRIDDERQALQDLVKGYKALLKAMIAPDGTSSEPPTFPQLTLPTRRSTVVGKVSMRSAVAEVLQGASEPLHSRDIYARANRMGAATTSKDPTSVVDLVVLDLFKKGKVEKVAPRTWQWRREG